MSFLDFYVVVLILIFILFVFFFFYLLKNKDSLSLLFSVFSLFSAICLFGVIGQLKSSSMEQILFFQKIKYIGLPFMAPTFLMFLFRIHNIAYRSPLAVFSLFVIPFIIFALVMTNEFHHLYYQSVQTFEYRGYLITSREAGPLYYLGFGYHVLMYAGGFYLTLKISARKNKNIKVLSYLLMASIVWSFLFHIFYLFKLLPFGVEIPLIGFLLQLLAFLWLMFYCRLFDAYELRHIATPKLQEGIIIIDNDFDLIYYNPAAKTMFDWLNPKLIGVSFSQTPLGKHLLFNDDVNFVLKLDVFGEEKHFNFNTTSLYSHNEKLKGFVYVFSDYTKRIQLENELKYLANYDGLTQLYNQITILNKAETAFKEAKCLQTLFSVVVIDANGFKRINDSFGHLFGNLVLKELATVIKEIFANEDCLLGRLGGDEFLIVCHCLEKDCIADKLADLVKRVGKIRKNKLKELALSISVGVHQIDFKKDADQTLEKAIHSADRAMYRAKEQGINIVNYY